jgi:hypothetical protein
MPTKDLNNDEGSHLVARSFDIVGDDGTELWEDLHTVITHRPNNERV